MGTEKTQSEQRKPDDAKLKWGYSAMYLQRYPHNKKIRNCDNPESAYFLMQEKEAMEILPELTLETILQQIQISEENTKDLINLWQQLQKALKALNENVELSHRLLENVPENIIDTQAMKIRETLLTAGIFIPEKFRDGVTAMISDPENHEDDKIRKELELWQSAEKNSRRGIQEEHKKYVTALRGYYVMLMELLPCSPHLEDMMERVIKLEIVDLVHSIIQEAKKLHHHQGKSRLRKTKDIPYVAHEIETAMAAIYDTLPHIDIVEATNIKMKLDIILALIHDLLEDTGRGAEEILDLITGIANDRDSTIQQYINTKYPQKYLPIAAKIIKKQRKPKDEREEAEMVRGLFQKDNIELINGEERTQSKRGLRVISNNVELRDKEKRTACIQNIAGREKTMALLGLTSDDIKMWEVNKNEEKPPKNTFQQYPKEYDNGKSAIFLIKLNAIEKTIEGRQRGLIAKLEERANNMQSLKEDYKYKFETLRSTTTRLIAWCMLDYKNHEEYPLFGALHRIIKVTLKAYREFVADYPKTEEKERPYIELLEKWQEEAKTFNPYTETEEQHALGLIFKHLSNPSGSR